MDKYYVSGDKINDYSIIKIIGEGRYGIVYLAENGDSEKVIIKQLKEDMLKKSEKKLFYEEDILKTLNNPKFPKFISKFEDSNVKGYILEYIEGSNFEDLVKKYDYKFNKNEIYTIAGQLIDIIQTLHENSIVHRDIRLPNIIVKNNNELVLIDFGLARYIGKKYIKAMDYWYLSDFLIHLYYTSYYVESDSSEPDVEEKPWFEELDLNNQEISFLKKLMGIDGKYNNIEEIKTDLKIIKNII